MANTIQIKHGTNVPNVGILNPFELGYVTSDGILVIGDENKEAKKLNYLQLDKNGYIPTLYSNDNLSFLSTAVNPKLWIEASNYNTKATFGLVGKTGQIYILEYPSNITYYERYNLPVPSANLTESKGYEILTSKGGSFDGDFIFNNQIKLDGLVSINSIDSISSIESVESINSIKSIKSIDSINSIGLNSNKLSFYGKNNNEISEFYSIFSIDNSTIGISTENFGYIYYAKDSMAFYVNCNGERYGYVIVTAETDGQLITQIRPNSNSNGKIDLGSSGRIFRNLYATNNIIQTSDKNLKTEIQPLNEKYIKLFDELQPVSYRLTGELHDRVHLGFISQDVEAAMNKIGISNLEFAGFCKDIKVDENNNPIFLNNGEPSYTYSLRYSEFIALNTLMIQRNKEAIAQLQEENKKLKQILTDNNLL